MRKEFCLGFYDTIGQLICTNIFFKTGEWIINTRPLLKSIYEKLLL